MKRALSTFMFVLLLVSTLTFAFNTQNVEASGTIYIRPDGSIDPPTAPISTVDMVTYTFTDNIFYDGIVVERSNIIVDGNGYTLQGDGSGNGFYWSGVNNVTIGNTNIYNHGGIILSSSSNNTISGNNIANNYGGIWLDYSSNNTISGNNINNYVGGIILSSSSNNTISGNNIANNGWGVNLSYSSNNTISGNNIANNYGGIWLDDSSNNRLFHNNFVNNDIQVYSNGSVNAWDDGYPSGGNYWSDYSGSDTNHDGIGDTPYIIDSNNVDNYPLMHPYGSITNLNTSITYLTIQSAINSPETLNGHAIFVRNGTYYENVAVNKTISLVGESKLATIIDGNGSGSLVEISAANVSISHFTMQNSGTYGIVLHSSHNKIVDNNIATGVYIWTSSGNSISRNSIMYGGTCIELFRAFNNSILENTITMASGNSGIRLEESGFNTIVRNNITNRYMGIWLNGVSNNIIYENEIRGNYYGIYHYYAPNNMIYHNNFVNNTNQVYTHDSVSDWDNGYPCGGNYWSDYIGMDVLSGPYQNVSGSDGIGDAPYVIDASNTDHYPLVNPFGSPPSLTYDLTILTTMDGTTNPTFGTYGYAIGSSINVTAFPNINYSFDHWELDTVNVGSTDPYTILMNSNHTLKAVFIHVPPLVASINPLSASICAGQSVTFTSTVSGGYAPYSYQWYLNGNPVSGATSTSWAFTSTTSGIYYIHLKVTDAKANTAQSETARITAPTVPVGGYSHQIQVPTKTEPLLTYIALIGALTVVFTKLKPKTKRKR